ncbi:hypothetical protein G3O08_19055 [Cryomorpha ignava]|uniref:Uncharacterized protein n=1 Tax=Cryomorpha ignava TaxID=101383 RepID=A0A7K3WY67_9FLAO|nr:hypothetical protein [Cryomorpha ignava]NEN25595.1 hypothetical protein [Cryomorpha ignava]
MNRIKLSLFILMLITSIETYAQNNSNLIIIRWSTVDKRAMNSGDAYFYIIDENSDVQKIEIGKEKLEEGKTAILIHKKLKEYYSQGYKLISSNFSTTAMGYCDKGEYILQKE